MKSSWHELMKQENIFKRLIRDSGQPDRNRPGFMDLLKYIKAVRHFGLFGHYAVAVTRTSINFSLILGFFYFLKDIIHFG